jgi:steroid 5-alpha reductase family enzyme
MRKASLTVAACVALLWATSAASARYSTMGEVWMLVSVCAAAMATLELFLLNRQRRLLLLDPWRRRFFVHRPPVLRSRSREDHQRETLGCKA